jgi:hypothetical protein
MLASSRYPRHFAPGALEGVQLAHDTELYISTCLPHSVEGSRARRHRREVPVARAQSSVTRGARRSPPDGLHGTPAGFEPATVGLEVGRRMRCTHRFEAASENNIVTNWEEDTDNALRVLKAPRSSLGVVTSSASETHRGSAHPLAPPAALLARRIAARRS